MPIENLLSKLGVLVIDNFMSAEECKALCLQMQKAKKTEAMAYSGHSGLDRIDHSVRKTNYCEVSDLIKCDLIKKTLKLKPTLESFFNTDLDDNFEHPKFLLYETGDFFSPHTDAQLNRKINLSVNLNYKAPNSETTMDDIDSYWGGDLMLYGLFKGNGLAKKGICAPSTIGSLIAYQVDVIHEVTPIEHGSRYAIVSRFLEQQ